MHVRAKLIIVLHWRHFQWQKVLAAGIRYGWILFLDEGRVFLSNSIIPDSNISFLDFCSLKMPNIIIFFYFLIHQNVLKITNFIHLDGRPLGVYACTIIKFNEIQRMASVWIHFNRMSFIAYCAAWMCALVLSKVACDPVSVWRLSCISFLSLLWRGSAPNELWLYTLLSTLYSIYIWAQMERTCAPLFFSISSFSSFSSFMFFVQRNLKGQSRAKRAEQWRKR